MKKPSPPEIHQVHISIGTGGHELVKDHEPEISFYAKEQEVLERNLLSLCPANLWPKGSHNSMSPRPILVTKEHQVHLAELHGALTTAITDIVDRWWTDEAACFPQRMPLEKKEEDLLRWLHGKVPEYRHCRGSWRPDFMVAENKCGGGDAAKENYEVTEINARFSFNGLLHQAHGQEALELMGVCNNGLVAGTSTEEIIEGMLSLFQHDRPLHLLKGEEPGMDIHMFKEIVQSQFGLEVRFISPTDLRLLSDPQSLGGHKLYCVIHGNGQGSSSVAFENGEFMEEVHQIGLELHQRELHAMKPDMLRQVALRCFNDMRTVFLVHDKRMLGIVKQELDRLVARHVLTLSQAETLDKSIADTFLPGSLRLAKLLKISKSSPEIRGEFLLKPVRGGKGEGIKFGDEYEPSEWISTLERLQSSELIPGQTCVVQRRIIPCLYDVVLKSSGKRAQYPLVGTYHAIHGKLLGFGVWRCSPDPICAISTGGSWTCTVQSNVQ